MIISLPFHGDYKITCDFAHHTIGLFGIDWGMPNGTPLYACFNGNLSTGTNPPGKDWGNYGWLACTEDSSFKAGYAHCQSFVTSGSVKRGQLIGYSDTTGLATGPHLHFTLLLNGKAVDPAPYLTGGGGDVNTPETNEILYKTILGQPQGTAGDAGAATNLNKPLEEVIKFMWNTQAAKDFQTWLTMVRDQFPKLQATVDDLRASFVKQTEEMDSMDKQITEQGKTINDQDTQIADLKKQVASLSTQLENASPGTSSGLAVPTLSSVLESIRLLIKKWLGGDL